MANSALGFDNPASPYYLHPNENPSLILVNPPLNGQNFHSWSRSMRMCLLSKNKLKFVDGSISVPSREDQMYPVWERCNTMVLSWLLHSLSPSIAQSILWIDSAVDVWKDLYDRFSQGDALRISDLQEEIYAFKQNNLSVTDYFTQLKILWDEYLNFRAVPVCSCIPQCQCNALKKVKDFQEGDYVIRFLKGLNESYSVIKQQILMMDPLPKINKVFSLALQNERQIGLNIGVGQTVEPSVFAAQSSNSMYRPPLDNRSSGYRASMENRSFVYKPPVGNFGSGNVFRPQGGQRRFYSAPNNGKPICSYCGFSGHSVDIYFKKHGYPPGYKSKSRTQSYVNQVGEVIMVDDQDYAYGQDQDMSYDQNQDMSYVVHESAVESKNVVNNQHTK
ncbi:uncharacterized protein LOC126655516 [Mercurialis annua]|uniref:uncharacterized protein LOC126655516 n=1 Tax=Mercurialis annua TaxID=3986 RepID=UPI002160C467|nr:uncharacterized protein LOC126655516 [Mercurialis annua]